MGKIRLKVVGDEQAEREQKEEQKKKAEAKRQAKGLNMGGGQRINAVGPTEEEIASEVKIDEAPKEEAKPKKKGKKAKARVQSKRFTQNASLIAKNTNYPLSDAIETLKKFKAGGFDETVELHINVKEKGVSGQVSLPHGTGKTLRIKVADDALIADVEKGKIEFDVLIAAPQMMPKLAKVARVLGPRGLMPNPKNGTITDKPEALIERLSKGQISYKTESAAPLIHLSVGKLSFEQKALEENVKTVLSSIGFSKIEKITLKSTMSPAIHIKAE